MGKKNPDSGCTAAAIYIPYFKYSTVKRLSNDVSVFTAEIMAILMALQWVEEINPISVAVCSDSYLVLNSLNSGKSASRQAILYEILQNLYRINQTEVFMDTHLGVEGHEKRRD